MRTLVCAAVLALAQQACAAEPRSLLLACEGSLQPRYGGEEVWISQGVTVDFRSRKVVTDIMQGVPVYDFGQYTTDSKLVAMGTFEINGMKNFATIEIDRITGDLDASLTGTTTADGKGHMYTERASMKCRPAQQMF